MVHLRDVGFKMMMQPSLRSGSWAITTRLSRPGASDAQARSNKSGALSVPGRTSEVNAAYAKTGELGVTG